VPPAELLADTPELIDRTTGSLQGDDLVRETAYLVADVLNKVLRYLEANEEDEPVDP
jgi:hypothetical protein